MVQATEGYLKQEILDRNPYVASAALTSAQSLILYQKGDVVRRWVNEVGQGMEHASNMTLVSIFLGSIATQETLYIHRKIATR